MIEYKVKEDCFAYTKKKCQILREIYCKIEHCKFYKTKEQDKEDLMKAKERFAITCLNEEDL